MSTPSNEDPETRLRQCLCHLTGCLGAALEAINRRLREAIEVHLRKKPTDEVRSCWTELGCVPKSKGVGDADETIVPPNVASAVGGPASGHAETCERWVDELISVLRQLMPENPRSKRYTRWEIAVCLTARAELYLYEGKLLRAHESFAAALRWHPESTWLRYQEGFGASRGLEVAFNNAADLTADSGTREEAVATLNAADLHPGFHVTGMGAVLQSFELSDDGRAAALEFAKSVATSSHRRTDYYCDFVIEHDEIDTVVYHHNGRQIEEVYRGKPEYCDLSNDTDEEVAG